jgi:hypothetical protein
VRSCGVQELHDAEGAAAGKGKAAAKDSTGGKESAAKAAQAPKEQKAARAAQAGKAKRKDLTVSAQTSSCALLLHIYTHTMYKYPPALFYKDLCSALTAWAPGRSPCSVQVVRHLH